MLIEVSDGSFSKTNIDAPSDKTITAITIGVMSIFRIIPKIDMMIIYGLLEWK